MLVRCQFNLDSSTCRTRNSLSPQAACGRDRKGVLGPWMTQGKIIWGALSIARCLNQNNDSKMNTSAATRTVRRGFQLLPRPVQSPSTQYVMQRCFHQFTSPSLCRSSIIRSTPATFHNHQLRHESSATGARPLTDRTNKASSQGPPKEDQPSYEMTFTCKRCTERSSHKISKQGYHKGTILITCPGCKNRHLISDHLKIFSDQSLTLEDILREKGQLLKKGTLGADGDVEFWDDGSTTAREDKKDQEQK